MAWSHEIPHVKRVLDTLERHKIKPHENELRFVRQLVDQGKFNHSWLPMDPEAITKKVGLPFRNNSFTFSVTLFIVRNFVLCGH